MRMKIGPLGPAPAHSRYPLRGGMVFHLRGGIKIKIKMKMNRA